MDFVKTLDQMAEENDIDELLAYCKEKEAERLSISREEVDAWIKTKNIDLLIYGLKCRRGIDPDYKLSIFAALGDSKDPRVIETLIHHVLHDTLWEYVASSAGNALAKIGSPAVEPLLLLITQSDENKLCRESKKVIIVTLGKIGDTRAIEIIKKISNDQSDLWLRDAANEALRRINEVESLRIFKEGELYYNNKEFKNEFYFFRIENYSRIQK